MEDFDPEAMRVLRYRAKGVLRQRMRALRNSIPRESLAERSGKIRAGLLGRPEVVGARTVALFWPIVKRGEVDLRPLVAELRGRGVRVAFPSIHPETRVMTFRIPADPAAMEEHGLGFQEPLLTDPEAGEVDVVVVPALGVDGEGNRIGYGAGYYDRTIPRFCPPGVAIGVVYDFQVLSEVPVTEGDVPLPVVVTDERVIEV
ncbi:5-formyltetrahydrofolate cyclo-ligase [Polyangium mundeleinium]|uniref:5-formyltetrahydrofolate cyclo-ligase n=1 Tax=Polyangium mundeleinium TaxID=2995306 RepID=A0ABT5EEF4_9BACT|nr:5-formyltetrahydrofolate cyclo-ligase [Polyangium mundeleinium]MDC0739869.1 5-formyltetrahydrofolate cyclo-ligase [Polyangium mundeleinium]